MQTENIIYSSSTLSRAVGFNLSHACFLNVAGSQSIWEKEKIENRKEPEIYTCDFKFKFLFPEWNQNSGYEGGESCQQVLCCKSKLAGQGSAVR